MKSAVREISLAVHTNFVFFEIKHLGGQEPHLIPLKSAPGNGHPVTKLLFNFSTYTIVFPWQSDLASYIQMLKLLSPNFTH